jgi:hypothetical protein
MAKTLSLASPIKVITSGTVPTTTNLKKGEWAYGVIGGKNRVFGNPTGSAIVEFSDVTSINEVSYNSTTAVLSFKSPNGITTINLPKENFLSATAYNPTTKKLSLTLTDDSVVEVSLSELVDSYVASSDGGLEVVGSNQFKIKAAGVVESMLASAITAKLNKTLSVSGGTAETGKYVSGISVSDHAITVTKTALPVSAADITNLQNGVDIYNVTLKVPLPSGNYYNESAARAAVPADVRKKGLIITYLRGGSDWIVEQYILDDLSGWATSTNWKGISPVVFTEATSQTISIGGNSKGVTATINAAAAVTGGGLKVTSGKLELDETNVTLTATVTEI